MEESTALLEHEVQRGSQLRIAAEIALTACRHFVEVVIDMMQQSLSPFGYPRLPYSLVTDHGRAVDPHLVAAVADFMLDLLARPCCAFRCREGFRLGRGETPYGARVRATGRPVAGG